MRRCFFYIKYWPKTQPAYKLPCVYARENVSCSKTDCYFMRLLLKLRFEGALSSRTACAFIYLYHKYVGGQCFMPAVPSISGHIPFNIPLGVLFFTIGWVRSANNSQPALAYSAKWLVSIPFLFWANPFYQ